MENYVHPHYTIYDGVLTQRNTLRFASFLHRHIEIIRTYKKPATTNTCGHFSNHGCESRSCKKQLEIIGLNDTQITNDTD